MCVYVGISHCATVLFTVPVTLSPDDESPVHRPAGMCKGPSGRQGKRPNKNSCVVYRLCGDGPALHTYNIRVLWACVCLCLWKYLYVFLYVCIYIYVSIYMRVCVEVSKCRMSTRVSKVYGVQTAGCREWCLKSCSMQ